MRYSPSDGVRTPGPNRSFTRSDNQTKARRNWIALAAAPVLTMLLTSAVSAAASFTPVAKTGDAVPGQGTNFTRVNIAGVDSNFGAAFIGSFSISATNYSGLYRKDNSGVVTTIADRGTLGPNGETINSIIANGDYENGVVVFAANTTLGGTPSRVLYRYTPGTGLTALVRQGDTLPGSTAPVNTFYNRGVSGDANDFAFGSALGDASTAVYTSVSGAPMRAVDDKTRSPIAETGNFVDFPELNYRNGKTAFVGRGADPDWPGPGPAPVEPAGIFVFRPGNPIDIVAGRNFAIPGSTSDLRFAEFERPRIMPDGRVAFAGGYIDEDAPNDPNEPRHMGVFIRNADLTWKTYMDSQMALPGLHGQIQEFNQFSLETDFNYFGVNDLTGGSYIYYESADGVFTNLIDTYQTIGGKSIATIRMLSDTALNGGQIFFRADFTDGTNGIFTTSVPEPTGVAAAAGAVMLGVLRRRRRNG